MSSTATRRSTSRGASSSPAFPTSPSAAASRSASPHCWELFELLAGGRRRAQDRDRRQPHRRRRGRPAWRRSPSQCVQISVDGATAATHERVRPGSSFAAAIGAIERLVARGSRRSSCSSRRVSISHEIVAAYDLAVALGCSAFVTGPLMRIGRAARDWDQIACSDEDWRARGRRAAGRARQTDATGALDLSLGHRHRNGDAARKSPGDAAGRAQRQGEAPERASVRARRSAARFAPARPGRLSRRLAHDRRCAIRRALPRRPALLRHANETWPMGMDPE